MILLNSLRILCFAVTTVFMLASYVEIYITLTGFWVRKVDKSLNALCSIQQLNVKKHCQPSCNYFSLTYFETPSVLVSVFKFWQGMREKCETEILQVLKPRKINICLFVKLLQAFVSNSFYRADKWELPREAVPVIEMWLATPTFCGHSCHLH